MSKTVFEAYNGIKKELENAKIEDFVFEAKQIIKHVTGMSNLEIINNYTRPLTEFQENLITVIIKQRLARYPLQYALGSWDFYGRRFKVGVGVLIPRQDTETVIDTALGIIKDKKAPKICDLCAGTGCIGITLAKERTDSSVTLLERFDEAIRYTEQNRAINVAVNTRVLKGDVLKGDGKDMQYDLIVSNPPYVKKDEMKDLAPELSFEPESALLGGEDGLDFYRAITENYKDALKYGGTLLFEIGSTQAEDVRKIMQSAGFTDIEIRKDLAENDRVIFGTLK